MLRRGRDTTLNESEDDEELDIAHNPRNKFLADLVFYIENVCESLTGSERRTCLADPKRLTEVLAAGWAIFSMNYRRFWGVAKSTFSDRNWPVAQEDINDAYATQMYIPCNPPVPYSTDLKLNLRGSNWYENKFEMKHKIVNSCTGVEIDYASLCLSSYYCIRLGDKGRFTRSKLWFWASAPSELHVETIRLYPKNVGFGGGYYVVDVKSKIRIE